MEIVDKGRAAESLKNTPVFKEAVDMYKRHIFEAWSSEETSERCRERLWIEQVALENVIAHLDSFINDGVYEKKRESRFKK